MKLSNINKLNEDDTGNNKNLLNNDKKTLETELLSELPEPRWIKVGEIKELYYYPLKSGRGKEINNCMFTELGISIKNNNHLTLRDR